MAAGWEGRGCRLSPGAQPGAGGRGPGAGGRGAGNLEAGRTAAGVRGRGGMGSAGRPWRAGWGGSKGPKAVSIRADPRKGRHSNLFLNKDLGGEAGRASKIVGQGVDRIGRAPMIPPPKRGRVNPTAGQRIRGRHATKRLESRARARRFFENKDGP